VLGAKQGCKANKPNKDLVLSKNANSLQVVKATKYLAVC